MKRRNILLIPLIAGLAGSAFAQSATENDTAVTPTIGVNPGDRPVRNPNFIVNGENVTGTPRDPNAVANGVAPGETLSQTLATQNAQSAADNDSTAARNNGNGDAGTSGITTDAAGTSATGVSQPTNVNPATAPSMNGEPASQSSTQNGNMNSGFSNTNGSLNSQSQNTSSGQRSTDGASSTTGQAGGASGQSTTTSGASGGSTGNSGGASSSGGSSGAGGAGGGR